MVEFSEALSISCQITLTSVSFPFPTLPSAAAIHMYWIGPIFRGFLCPCLIYPNRVVELLPRKPLFLTTSWTNSDPSLSALLAVIRPSVPSSPIRLRPTANRRGQMQTLWRGQGFGVWITLGGKCCAKESRRDKKRINEGMGMKNKRKRKSDMDGEMRAGENARRVRGRT